MLYTVTVAGIRGLGLLIEVFPVVAVHENGIRFVQLRWAISLSRLKPFAVAASILSISTKANQRTLSGGPADV